MYVHVYIYIYIYIYIYGETEIIENFLPVNLVAALFYHTLCICYIYIISLVIKTYFLEASMLVLFLKNLNENGRIVSIEHSKKQALKPGE